MSPYFAPKIIINKAVDINLTTVKSIRE